MLYLSRTVVELLAPFPLSIILLLLTLLCLMLRKVRLGALCLVAALVLQIFCGYGFWVRQRIADLEAAYPAVTEAGLRALQERKFTYVVVLGSGHVSDNRLPAVSQIGGTSLFRLVEGIRIMRLKEESKLVICGGAVYDPVPNAEVVGRVAEALGVAGERMIIENRPRDTIEEAELLFPLLGREEFVLVTSAMHMPRAMQIFRDRGMNPLPAPTDYLIKNEVVASPGRLLPAAGNLELSRRILYEWIAEQWMLVKKYTRNYL